MRRTAQEALSTILSDSEDLDINDYDHDSDFEIETDHNSGESDLSDDDAPVVANGLLASSLQPRRGRGRGAGILRAQSMDIPPGWSINASSFVAQPFTPQVNGCLAVGPKEISSSINGGSSPLAFLSLFWDDALWEVLVNETNRQAFYVATDKPNCYNAKSWTDTTVQEMKAFFGCRTAIEMLIHKDRYEQYWRCKDNLFTNTPGFQKVFTRDRFLAIWSMLHCVDEKNPTVDKSDKIYKTRPVFNYILERFQKHYVPDQHLSLDEGMIPTKNSLSIKQYIKDKPIRWGLKTFLLTDSEHGYIVNAEVYTGRRDDSNDINDLGVTGNLVVRLTKDFQGKNYIVYTDRFYTSVHLCEYLLTKGIGACGTAMTNRRSFPKCLQRKPRQMSKGDSKMLFNGKVGAIVWMDKKAIHFVTSVFVDQPCTSVSRYDGAVHRKVPVSCPEAVKKYNQFMGGTDKNDQMTRLQRCRRHYKWPRRLMMKFFMWTTYNAYVIQGYYIPHAQAGKRVTTYHSFLEQLCNELVGDVRTTTQQGRRRSDADPDVRLSNVGRHEVERAEHATTNNRCTVCSENYRRAKLANPSLREKDLSKRSKTVYWCNYCCVFLCIGVPRSNCWHDWHTKVQYWR